MSCPVSRIIGSSVKDPEHHGEGALDHSPAAEMMPSLLKSKLGVMVAGTVSRLVTGHQSRGSVRDARE